MTGRSGEVVTSHGKEEPAREIGGGYKLYYHGEDGMKNGLGIVLCEELKDRVLAVERPTDIVMRMKLENEGEVGNIISCYAPQTAIRNMKRINSGEPLIVICKL